MFLFLEKLQEPIIQLNYNFWLCVELFKNHGVNLLHMTIRAVCV